MRARALESNDYGEKSSGFAFMISMTIKAARSAPRCDPAKSQDFRSRAEPRNARSAALFVRQILPSFRKDIKPSQCLSM